MRVLCLTSRLPYPPNRGDRLRAFHFFESLAEEHQLTLISFVSRSAEREHLDALRPYFEEIRLVEMPAWRSTIAAVAGLWRSDPLQALYYRSRAMQAVVDETIAGHDFDAVYVHLFRMAPYVAEYKQLYRIVDLTDVISREVQLSLPYRGLFWRLVYRFERPRIARYETWVARHFEETWLISDADARVLQEGCPGANIQVIRNGVDTENFRPLESGADPKRLLFVGHMGVFHNIDAATFLVQEILPLVREKHPECSVQIVGAAPAPAIRRLAEENAGVEVTGFVPDLNLALNEAAVFVAPLRFAAGVQNKVLEAMAAGRPVVTTSLVNDGVGARDGTHLLVADEARAAAAHIVSLLDSPLAGSELGRSARRFVRRRFRWALVAERMRAIAAEQSRGSGTD